LYTRWLLGSLVVAAAVCLAGCGNSPVAVVNGVRITEAEFNERLVQQHGQTVLSKMISRQLIMQMATRLSIEVPEEEISKRLEEFKKLHGSDEEFNRRLAAEGLSEEQLREEWRFEWILHRLMVRDVKYEEKELKKYFEENKDKFGEPIRVSLSEIVVASKADAEEVLAELKKGEASFADLARAYSLSPYGKREGGKQGEDIPLTAIRVEAVRKAAATVPVGKVSAPIPLEGQWYLIKVDDRKPARAPSWDKDKEAVKRRYEDAHAKTQEAVFREALKDSKVQIVDPRFQELNEIYTPLPEKMPEFGAEKTRPEPAEEAKPPTNEAKEGGS
jgi:foldase protein PrsA